MLDNGAGLEATNCAFERNWGRNGGAIDVKVGTRPADLATPARLLRLPARRLPMRRCTAAKPSVAASLRCRTEAP